MNLKLLDLNYFAALASWTLPLTHFLISERDEPGFSSLHILWNFFACDFGEAKETEPVAITAAKISAAKRM